MSAIEVVAFGAAFAGVIIFVKSAHREAGQLLSLAVGVYLAFVIVKELLPTVEYMRELASLSSFSEYMPYIFKSLAIGFASSTASEICADAGEGAIASKLQTVGKLAITAVCLPLVRAIASAALGYL